ncbi:MAG: outer membrane protein assembly factor BamB [Planctomycetota bacterium]
MRWKSPLPGLGHSSPVVWGDRIFLTSAEGLGEAFSPLPETAPGAHDNLRVTRAQRYLALAYDRKTGKELWRRALTEAIPHEGGHTSGSYASASPITDGKRLYVSFGSRGLFCLDFDGAVFWEADAGEIQTKHGHGEGSSPALHDNRLLVNQDHEGASYLLALDTETGEVAWKVQRDEPTSWSSPIVYEFEGRAQVIVSAAKRIRAYDLKDGSPIWECGGLSNNVVATPIAANGRLFAGSSYEKQAFIGIDLAGAKGDLAGTDNILWYRRRGTPYVPSPLLYDDTLYFLNHYQGFLARVDAPTGRDLGRPMRLPGIDDVYASLVGAANRLYIVDRSGLTLVLSHDTEPKILASNTLQDSFSATPALSGTDLFLRGERYLYCLTTEE